ncbi:MAG: ABC transporter permease, partial [Actinobacteria bacterium]
MATIEAPAPTVHERVRPEWLENIGGQLLALVAALVIALLLGSVIILAYGESPVAVYGAILTFSFGSRDGFGYVISIATPLIFSALAVAVCFKGGMFNIGVEGQYLVGMVAAAWAALKLDFLPGPLLMWVTIAFGMLGAVAFASVPAVLKVKTGAHEVVTTIMMNGIAISFVAWAINGPLHFTQQLAGFNINLRTDLFKA